VIIVCIKVLIFLLRKLTPYSATALPGLLLEDYFPSTLKKLSSQLDKAVFITGTNGKTTTAKMLGTILKSQEVAFIANPSGSNMTRGIATSLLDHCDWRGNLSIRTGIFEVEERTMPKLVGLIKPEIIIITNIFRDQLDAYGEVDKTLSYLASAISSCQPKYLILNADDHRVASLAKIATGKVSLIGLDKPYRDQIKWENRGPKNVDSDYLITDIAVRSDLGTEFLLSEHSKKIARVSLRTPGIYNCFNAAAALLCARELTGKLLPAPLSSMSPAFGRGEIIEHLGARFRVLLVKNPAGMNLNWQLINRAAEDKAILFILNDKVADGCDVSWIWDCEFNDLPKNAKIYVAGTRRWDMVLRLTYSGIHVDKVYDKLSSAIFDLSTMGKKVFVLPTYTAMLEFRRELGKKTKVSKIWQQ